MYPGYCMEQSVMVLLPNYPRLELAPYVILFPFLSICTDKYMRKKKVRTLCWSTYGAQLLCVQSFTLLWVFLPLIPLAGLMAWLAQVDSTRICLFQFWTKFFNSQVPNSVQLGVLAVNLWTALSATFLCLCSMTKLLFYLFIAAFWTRLGARGESWF